MFERRRQAYEKNYAKAEEQAQQMLQSVSDDANVNAAGELKEYFGLS